MIDELEYSDNNQGEIVRQCEQNMQDQLGIHGREEGVNSMQNRERMWKALRVKHHFIHKGKHCQNNSLF